MSTQTHQLTRRGGGERNENAATAGRDNVGTAVAHKEQQPTQGQREGERRPISEAPHTVPNSHRPTNKS